MEAAAAEGWPNLPLERAVVGPRELVIAAPWRGQAPRGSARAPGQAPAAQADADLARALSAWDAAARAGGSAVLAEQREALEALGYLQGVR